MAQQLDVLSNHSGFRHNVTNGTNLLSNPNASAGLRINATENLDIAVNADPTTIYDITTMQQMTPFTCQNTPTPSASVTKKITDSDYSAYVVAHTANDNTHIGASDANQYIPEVVLEDKRECDSDGLNCRTYIVRKLADGNCWMAQNLKLDIKGINQDYATAETYVDTNGDGTRDTFTGTKVDATFNLSSAYTDLNSISNWNINTDPEIYATQKYVTTENKSDYAWSKDSYTNLEKPIRSYSPGASGANYFVITSDTSYSFSATSLGDEIMRTGNLYTYYAATAGTAKPDNTSSEIKIVNNNSICPKGWRLPYGGSDTNSNHTGGNDSKGFYYLLVTTYDIDKTFNTTLVTFPYSILVNGQYNFNGSNNAPGTGSTKYWTATTSSRAGTGGYLNAVYTINYDWGKPQDIGPGNGHKGVNVEAPVYGFGVRCVAR